MPDVSESLVVDAPLGEVFAFMDVPENQVAITPGLKEVRDVTELDNGGKRIAFTYGMAGVDLDGVVEAVEYVPRQRIVFDMRGAIEGTIRWSFEPVGRADGAGREDGPATGETGDDGDPGGTGDPGANAPRTRVTYAADYRIPGGIDRVAAPVLRRYNERQARKALENLAAALDADGGD